MERVEMGLRRIRFGLGDILGRMRMRDVSAITATVEPLPASRPWLKIPVTPDEIVTAWMQEWRDQVGD